MKKLLFAILCLFFSQSYGQVTTDTKYRYSISPRTKEWNSYKNANDRKVVLQIPEDVLQNVSTQELLDICLEYPYLVDIMCYNSIQEGFNAVLKDFNGFRELIKRDNIANLCLSQLKKASKRIGAVSLLDSFQRGKFAYQTFVLDLIILHDPVFSKISESKKKDIFAEMIAVCDSIEKRSNLFGGLTGLAKSMIRKSISQGAIRSYDPNIPDYDPDNYENIAIYTKYNNNIPYAQIYNGTDVQPGSVSFNYLMHELYYGYNLSNMPVYQAKPSYKYNCHGYAWWLHEGGDSVWIGYTPHIFWDEGSYDEVSESEATHVTYAGNHSAIRINSQLYESKWGMLALVRHSPDNVPSNYLPNSTKRYFKKRDFHIYGPLQICNTASYSVSNIVSGSTVNWSYSPLTGNSYAHPYIQSTQGNTCTLYRSYQQLTKGILTATIYYQGNYISQCSTYIYGDNNTFVGYWWSGDVYMDVLFNDDNWARPNYPIYVESDNLQGKTVKISTSSAPTNYTTLNVNGNSIQFNMPNLSSNEYLTLWVLGGCTDRSFKFYPMPSKNSTSTLQVCLQDDHRLLLMVTNQEVEEKAIIKKQSEEKQFNSSWVFRVYNATDLRQILAQFVEGNSFTLDTSSWSPGIYIIRANIEGKPCSAKITLK